MRYLLLIYNNPNWDAMSEAERDAMTRGHRTFDGEIAESGEAVTSNALADPANSTTVRVRDGVIATTDGPYVEAKEYLAGFYVVECESLDRAVELAARIPDASSNAVEIRPVMDPFAGLEM